MCSLCRSSDIVLLGSSNTRMRALQKAQRRPAVKSQVGRNQHRSITGTPPRSTIRAFALYTDSGGGLWSPYHHNETYVNQPTRSRKGVFRGRAGGRCSRAHTRVHSLGAPGLCGVCPPARGTSGGADAPVAQWRSLLDPAQLPNPEPTSSAGITAGVARKVDNGMLPANECRGVVEAAWFRAERRPSRLLPTS